MSKFARSFERTADAYERGRPGYADAALDTVPVRPDAVVLDLAAGTGKLTRQLVRRFERVVAVEPLPGMRAVLQQVVPEAEALPGKATEIPLEDDGVDAVFVAEAFHWFGNDDAVREIARVLRPGGTLAILFNQADGKIEPPLPQAFRDVLDAVALVKPPELTVRSGLWRTPFPGPFEPFTERSFANAVELDREGMLANVASWSTVAGLSGGAREQLLEQLSTLLPEGSYRHPLSTHLYLTTLSEGG